MRSAYAARIRLSANDVVVVEFEETAAHKKVFGDFPYRSLRRHTHISIPTQIAFKLQSNKQKRMNNKFSFYKMLECD